MRCWPIPGWRGIWTKAIDSPLGKTHLTGMGIEVKVSSKGQLVIPKDVRERLGWPQGSRLEIIETGDGVLLRKPREKRPKLTVGEATAELRKLYRHKGPPIPVEKLSWPGGFYDTDPVDESGA